MVFVFTAMVLFYTFLFWNIVRFNRMAEQHNTCKVDEPKKG